MAPSLALWATALLAACGQPEAIDHGADLGVPYSGGTPGAPCQDDDVPEAGSCIDYGPDGYDNCADTASCEPNYVCRGFDVPACTCDPRPGAWEECAPRCGTDDDCNRSRDGGLVGWGFVCDTERGFCRTPPSCLTDADCDGADVCADGDWLHWYVAGDGQLSEMAGPRRCTSVGDLPEGADCRWADECASGACAGERFAAQCDTACTRNDACEPGQSCAQLEHGPPVCTAATISCEGEGSADRFCRAGQWVTACERGADCETGDCEFPDSAPETYSYGGLGFGVGACTETSSCAPDEFRAAWVDAWVAPTCFSARPCWADDDCAAPQRCMELDAVGSTRRCGMTVAKP